MSETTELVALDARTDVPTFAREVLGIDVFDYQAEALRCAAPVVVIAGGRRSGKSAMSQVKALHTVFTRRNVQAIVATANAAKGREWLRECVGLLREARVPARLDDQATRLTLDGSGSSIVVVPPTAGQIRGFGRDVFFLLVDEAGFLPAGFWRDARYVMLDNVEQGGQAWIVGSPWGGPEHFFRQSWEQGFAGDEGYRSFQWRTAMNPTLPAGWLEAERRRLPSHEVGPELDGEWGDAQGAFFPLELLRRQVADVVVPPMRHLVGPARPMLGLDWGHVRDQSSAVFVYRLPMRDLNPGGGHVPRFVALPYVWVAGTPFASVVDEIGSCRAPFSVVSSEVNGVGAMPSQEVVRQVQGRRRPGAPRVVWNLTFTTAATKTAGYAAVLSLLERGQLVLPRHPEFLRQLAGVRYEQMRGGALRLEAEDAAVHDDIADALYLATGVFAPARRGMRVKVQLAHVARAELAQADVAAGGEGGEVVETEGGLRVWARPPLQSAYATRRELERGPAVTWPAGW